MSRALLVSTPEAKSSVPEFSIRPMTVGDWDQVRPIYLEGIAGGNATFETEAPSWAKWDSCHLSVGRLVAESQGRIVGWAALSPISQRKCYAGVQEVSVYVAATAWRLGIGKSLLLAVVREAEGAGIWTLQGSVFPENTASLRMCEAAGFRLVGKRERIGRLNGIWRDTVLVERRSAVVGQAE